MTISNLNLPNKAPETRFLAIMMEQVETGLYSAKFLNQATTVLQDTSGTYNLDQKQDAYQFILAFQNQTDFVSKISLGANFPAGVEINCSLFAGRADLQEKGTAIKNAVDASLKQIQGTMEDPSKADSPSTAVIYNSQTKQPATMYDMIVTPGVGFYFEWSHNMDDGDQGSPNWAPKSFIDTTIKYAGAGSENASVDDTDAQGAPIPYGGISNTTNVNDGDIYFVETAKNIACFAPYASLYTPNATTAAAAQQAVTDALKNL